MSDEKLATILAIIMTLLAVAVAIIAIPEPTGDSSVYEKYTEEMRNAGRYPNGELIDSNDKGR